MRTSTVAAAAMALAAPAIAQDAPLGNPFNAPGAGAASVVAGKPYHVKWTAEQTTPHGKCSTVDLVLIAGPNSQSLVPTATLASGIANSGSFAWTPAATIDTKTKYGIKLVCTESKDYQYTNLFEVSPNADLSAAGKTTTPAPSTTANPISANGTTSDAGVVYTTAVVTHLTTYCPEATTLTIDHKTYTITSATTLTISDCSCTVRKPIKTPSTAAAVISTPYPIVHNDTMTTLVYPTGGPASDSAVTVEPTAAVPQNTTGPVSPEIPLATPTDSNAAETSAPVFEGAASSIKTSIAGAVAAFAIAIFAL